MAAPLRIRKANFQAAQSARQAQRPQNIQNRLAATGAQGGGVIRTPRGPVVSVTTSSGARASRNLKTGVGFGVKASGQKYVKPSSRPGR